MKILKSLRNDFPEWYAEYSLKDIGDQEVTKYPEHIMPLLKKNIINEGMIHPVVIWSANEKYQTQPNPVLPDDVQERKKILKLYLGYKRVRIAKELGYTHISAYHVRTQEEACLLIRHTTVEEFTEEGFERKVGMQNGR